MSKEQRETANPPSPHQQGLIGGLIPTEGAMRVGGQDYRVDEYPSEADLSFSNHADFVKGLLDGVQLKRTLAEAGFQVVPAADEAQTAPAKPTMDLNAMSSEQLTHAFGGSE